MPTRVFTEDEKELLKEKMLESGLPLLKKYGMTHMSVSKITDVAGIGTSTFYNFWKNKEEYVAELYEYQEKKIFDMVILKGEKKKLGRKEAKEFLKLIVDDKLSVIPYLTLEDESKIINDTTAFVPNFTKESKKTLGMLSNLSGVKKNVNPALIANLVKVLALTAESKVELHKQAYNETIDSLINNILNLIFE